MLAMGRMVLVQPALFNSGYVVYGAKVAKGTKNALVAIQRSSKDRDVLVDLVHIQEWTARGWPGDDTGMCPKPECVYRVVGSTQGLVPD